MQVRVAPAVASQLGTGADAREQCSKPQLVRGKRPIVFFGEGDCARRADDQNRSHGAFLIELNDRTYAVAGFGEAPRGHPASPSIPFPSWFAALPQTRT